MKGCSEILGSVGLNALFSRGVLFNFHCKCNFSDYYVPFHQRCARMSVALDEFNIGLVLYIGLFYDPQHTPKLPVATNRNYSKIVKIRENLEQVITKGVSR